MVKNMIMLKESFMHQIHECRVALAELKERRAKAKPPLWEIATGTVDQKKDFIKSEIAEFDKDIAVLEADIELYYNQIRVLDDKIELEYLSDE